jgi:hypothetical protein
VNVHGVIAIGGGGQSAMLLGEGHLSLSIGFPFLTSLLGVLVFRFIGSRKLLVELLCKIFEGRL